MKRLEQLAAASFAASSVDPTATAPSLTAAPAVLSDTPLPPAPAPPPAYMSTSKYLYVIKTAFFSVLARRPSHFRFLESELMFLLPKIFRLISLKRILFKRNHRHLNI